MTKPYGILKIILAITLFYLLYFEPSEKVQEQENLNQQKNSNTNAEIEQDEKLVSNENESDNIYEQEEINNSFRDLFGAKFYQDEFSVGIQSSVDNLPKLMENYIQRYVSLFLRNSGLKDLNIVSQHDETTATIEVTLTSDELAFLQNYGKSKKPKTVSALQRDLNKLDRIMSKMAPAKQKNSFEWGKYFLEKLESFSWKEITSFNPLLNSYILIFVVTIICTFFISPSASSNKLLYAIFLAVNNIILYEGFLNYEAKLRDAKILHSHTLKKLEPCDSSQSWYSELLNYFREEPCLNYKKNLVKDPAEDISLLECIIDSYALYFIHKPFQIFGKSARNIAKEITADMPVLLRGISQLGVGVTVGFMGLLVLLIICGTHLKLSFFGTSIHLGKTQPFYTEEKLKSPEVPQIESAKKTPEIIALQ